MVTDEPTEELACRRQSRGDLKEQVCEGQTAIEIANRHGIPLDLISVAQAAECVSVPENTIRQWLRSRTISWWGRADLGLERVSLAEVRGYVRHMRYPL